jgi:hypothetical protein
MPKCGRRLRALLEALLFKLGKERLSSCLIKFKRSQDLQDSPVLKLSQ